MINAIQAAIYARLTDQLAVEVYDHVPQAEDSGDDSLFPYVVMDDYKITSRDTNDRAGYTGTMLIHVWSRGLGFKETQELQLAIYNAMHEYALTATGYGISSIHQEFCEILRDSDTITRHGVQRFRIIAEPTS